MTQPVWMYSISWRKTSGSNSSTISVWCVLVGGCSRKADAFLFCFFLEPAFSSRRNDVATQNAAIKKLRKQWFSVEFGGGGGGLEGARRFLLMKM